MFDVDRMHYFAARHPIEVYTADCLPIARHFNIERRNSTHRDHDRIRAWQTDSRAKFARSQYLRARFVPRHQFWPRVGVIVKEQTDEHDLIIACRTRHADAKDLSRRA